MVAEFLEICGETILQWLWKYRFVRYLVVCSLIAGFTFALWLWIQSA
jgi:hypothetical protein